MIAPNQLMMEESLLRLLEAIRHTGADQQFAPLTASIGLSYSGASHTQQLSELLKQADIALYQAKRGGRDQVCCYHEPTPT
jgi:diguanylate cyclase (GGDEF)-like protein